MQHARSCLDREQDFATVKPTSLKLASSLRKSGEDSSFQAYCS